METHKTRGASCLWALTLCLLLAPLAAGEDLDAVVALVEKGDLGAAEKGLRTLLSQDDQPMLRDLLGVVLSRQGRASEAEQQFKAALEADPQHLDARQHLGRLYLQQKRQTDALRELRSAAELGPLERDLAMNLAAAELSMGNPSAAERQLESVAERFQSVRALLQWARLASNRGDHETAFEALRQAQAAAPNSEEVLSTQARAALAAGLPVPAIMSLEPLTRMYPDVVEHAYLMGVSRLQVGDMPGSVEALRHALDLEPGRSQTLIALGLALNHQKRFAESRDLLTRGLALDPKNTDAVAALAEAENGLSQLEAAERHALRALSQNPEQATANLVLGMVRMKQNRYEEARDAFTASVEADPQSARTYYQLSLALARLGERDASREHLETYRRLLREDEATLLEMRSRIGLDKATSPSGATP